MNFSFIIPTFNSEKYIKKCLDSIFNIDYPKNKYEVIVVDGGSKDKTLQIIKKYPAKIIHSKNISISNSRNLGARKAKGKALAFIDSDCVVNKNILNKASIYLNNYAAYGSVSFKAKKNSGWVSKSWLRFIQKKEGEVNWLPTGTLIILKDAFEKINGFNEELKTGEDFDLGIKIKNMGYKIFNDPQVSSIHLDQTDTLIDFFRKETWRGSSLIKRIGDQGLRKAEIASTFITFYYFILILLLPVSIFIGLKGIYLILILIFSPPLLPSLKKIISSGNKKDIIYFPILFFVYQTARSWSIVRYNQLSNLFKRKKEIDKKTDLSIDSNELKKFRYDFSFVIPTFNSEKYIKKCLDSIFNIDYPKNKYEVIVVDGGSKDKTLQIIKKYPAKIIHSKNISISNSRNLGAKKAKGKALAFIDSDCIINKNILKKSFTLLKEYSCLGSFYKASPEQGWVAKNWLNIEWKKKGPVNWIPAGTLLINRLLFNKINGFDELLITQEDFDICYRIKKEGYIIYNEPKISSVHLGQTDRLDLFFKKEVWRGCSLIRGIKNHGWSKEELPSLCFNFSHIILFLFLIYSFFLGKNLVYLSIPLILFPSLFLSFKKIIELKNIGPFFYLFILFFVYQSARAWSIIRYNQIKDLF